MDDTELDRRRPLEIRLRKLDDPGFAEGTTEREARRFGRYSADVAVLLRGLVGEEGLSLGVVCLNGHNLEGGGEIGTSALFHLWVSFTGHLARRTPDPEDPQGLAQIVFANKVLGLLDLDAEMRVLTPPASSTPDEPAPPAGEPAPSTG